MQLREYQEAAVQKALAFQTFGFFDEQRTGKTPTAITWLERQGCHKPLILCPKTAVYNWAEEYEAWSNKPAIVVTGTPRQRKKRIALWDEGAVIMGYDTLKVTTRSEGMLQEVLTRHPDSVVADEAHRFKTPKTAIFKAMKKLTNIPFRVALTGTPAPGKPEEVYAILHWLRPTEYPSYWGFIDRYFQKVRRTTRDGRTYMDIIGFKPGMERILQLELSEFTTQQKRFTVMPWLPEKDYQDVKLPLTVAQKKYLKELEKYFETEHVIVQGILDRLIRYRQICLAPELLDLKGNSPKMDWVLDYLTDYPEVPTIVFSKFTSFLKILRKKVPTTVECGMIIGETSAEQRQQHIQNFQRGTCNLLLINIDAGKEALTLDRGECIIFTDQYPPAADIQQAEDRFVATTEARANKPHKIVRLMMAKSYDEQIYKLIEQRASVIDLINNYQKYLSEQSD